MHFHFFDGNHTEVGRDTLIDIRNCLAGMLIDLGHGVTKSSDQLVTRPSINVLFEGFGRKSSALLAAISKQDFDFLIVCTEAFGKKAMNDSAHRAMRMRQRWLPEVAKIAKACWCLAPGMAEQLKQYCENSFDVELGWSQTQESVLLKDEAPKHPFVFYGGLNERRASLVNAFEGQGHHVALGEDYGPILLRNDLVRQSKVVLGLKPTNSWKLFSSSRAQTALHLGRPVIFEDVDDSAHRSPWRDIVVVSESECFGTVAVEMMKNWQDCAAEQMEKFREILPPQRSIGPALEMFAG